jgi:hypothetical protein
MTKKSGNINIPKEVFKELKGFEEVFEEYVELEEYKDAERNKDQENTEERSFNFSAGDIGHHLVFDEITKHLPIHFRAMNCSNDTLAKIKAKETASRGF